MRALIWQLAAPTRAGIANQLVPHQATFALLRNQANTATPTGNATR